MLSLTDCEEKMLSVGVWNTSYLFSTQLTWNKGQMDINTKTKYNQDTYFSFRKCSGYFPYFEIISFNYVFWFKTHNIKGFVSSYYIALLYPYVWPQAASRMHFDKSCDSWSLI